MTTATAPATPEQARVSCTCCPMRPVHFHADAEDVARFVRFNNASLGTPFHSLRGVQAASTCTLPA